MGVRKLAAQVFVSYRRDDSGHQAGRIAQSLELILGAGAVFLDTSSIEPGAEWPDTLRGALDSAHVVIVVIGPNWLRLADEWGYRRIDQPDDWVRQEIEFALLTNKRIVPVCVDGDVTLREDKLPDSIAALARRQRLVLRRDHWSHDVKLLISSIRMRESARASSGVDYSPYPIPSSDRPDPLSPEKIALALNGSLSEWSWRTQQAEYGRGHIREEFYRRYVFPSFQSAIDFMAEVAPGCDIAIHHPHWENIFKTLYVHLTTFDIGHKISDRDVQLAKYLDRAYADFNADRSDA